MKKILFFISLCAGAIFATAQPNAIATIAGTGSAGFSGDGGPATIADLDFNSGIWVDSSGSVYIADLSNNRIRKVSSSGIINTVAGGGTAGLGDGGPATAAELNYPQGVAADNLGDIFIADEHNNRVRKVDPAGNISTYAGTGSGGYSGDGGPASAATIDQPSSVAVDNLGNLFIADQNNNCIRKVNSAGIISTIAGNSTAGYSGDGGPATAAEINWPCAVSLDHTGNLYIGDFANNRVRKVNASGIISTIAGNGTGGYAGDGGPATAAEICNHWGGVYPDNLGNIYIADRYNNRVRKVDASGIITTVAGTGAVGYSGDGGPATAAELSGDNYVFVDGSNNVFISDQDNAAVRKIQYAPTYVADSFSVYISGSCSGPSITVATHDYSAGMYVKTYYGDGMVDSENVSTSLYASFSHMYANSGTYTVKNILYNSGVAIDSLSYPYVFSLCNSTLIEFYLDANGDCIKEDSEILIPQPFLTEIDSNGIAIDTISSTSGFYYTCYGSAGDVYQFRVLSTPSGTFVSCPASAILSVTLGTGSYNLGTKYIALQCTSGSSFDLAVRDIISVTGVRDQCGNIYATNTFCDPEDATITLNYSQKYGYMGAGHASPDATSYTDSTITWNFTGVSPYNSIHIYYGVNDITPTGPLTVGDTVHNTINITPLVGDVNSANNHGNCVDTVKASCDPNEMSVSPSGTIPMGVNTLQYTIQFENTGNDTAFNIYVMDTLSPDVDVSTMLMEFASANMFITKVQNVPGYNILKFDFPNINLLDSNYKNDCSGALIFDINTKPGLPAGTSIFNHAGIFFDDNPVVMTDTVEDVIGQASGIPSVNQANQSRIFPNPASNTLNVEIGQDSYNSATIFNSIGQQLIETPLNGIQTKVSISQLPEGIYYIILKGNDGSIVDKFVKY